MTGAMGSSVETHGILIIAENTQIKLNLLIWREKHGKRGAICGIWWRKLDFGEIATLVVGSGGVKVWEKDSFAKPGAGFHSVK